MSKIVLSSRSAVVIGVLAGLLMIAAIYTHPYSTQAKTKSPMSLPNTLIAAPSRATSFAAPSAPAATINVNSLEDNVTPGNRLCTLREAITNANADRDTTSGDCAAGSGADTITINLTGTISLLSALPSLDSSMTIRGRSRSDRLEVRRNSSTEFRIFNIGQAATVTFNYLKIANGRTPGSEDGGGIRSYGNLTVSDCEITGNNGLGGGGIANFGQLTVNSSTINGNVARIGGGGLYIAGNPPSSSTNATASATLTNCTISGNSAGIASGIWNHSVSRCTGGIFCSSSTVNLTLEFCTITANSGAGAGGVIRNETYREGAFATSGTAALTVRNTLVAANFGANFFKVFTGSNTGGNNTINSLGNNLNNDGSDAPDFFPSRGDLIGSPGAPIDAKLGPLTSFKDTTPNHLLLCGSPAIDKGARTPSITQDQRGFPRFFGSAPDIGAVEANFSLAAIPATLPAANPRRTYTANLRASLGNGPYTFTPSAALPFGFTLTPEGLLSGTTTAIGGTLSFPVMAVDAEGRQGCLTYSLPIVCPTIAITPVSIAQGTVNSFYSQSFSSSGGLAPLTYSLTGNLPGGLSFDSGMATLSGTPIQSGSFQFSIRVTEVSGCSITVNYTLVVNCQQIAIGPETISAATTGVPYRQGFTADGTVGIPNFQLVSTPPPGLSLGGFDGMQVFLSGTPRQAGFYTLNIRVSDQNNCSTTRQYSLIVNEGIGTIVVNSPEDTTIRDDLKCTLREALINANTGGENSGGDCRGGGVLSNIIFLNLPGDGSGTINLNSPLPEIERNLTINGPGASLLTIRRSTGGDYRIFTIQADKRANISGLTIANGRTVGSFPADSGGGILNSGTLTLTNCLITGNTATGFGGGVFNLGTLTVESSTFSANQASVGGGLALAGGSAAINNSTISRNTATDAGGLVSQDNNPQLTNSTISGNKAFSGAAGGILNVASSGNRTSMALDSCTITGNSSSAANNGVAILTGTGDGGILAETVVMKTLIAANAGTNFGENSLKAVVTSRGNNLDSDGTSGFTNGVNGNLVGSLASPIDARLTPLGNHGGATQTHLLLCGSPAIDAGGFTMSQFDQRGTTRQLGTQQDIGAVETKLSLTTSPNSLPDATVSAEYAQPLFASGGASPYGFTLIGDLPPGLRLGSTGQISGTPTKPGKFDFTLMAVDAEGAQGCQSYSLTVNCQTIAVSPATVQPGTAGVAYSQNFAQSGGAGSITFSLTGSLPRGLSLNSQTGALTGTPTEIGSFNFKITATDANGCTGSADYSLTINCAGAIAVAPDSLSVGTVGVAVNQTFTASGGAAPYKFTVTAGALPPGLRLLESGALLGSPTAQGVSSFTVTATDAYGCSGSATYSLTVYRRQKITDTLGRGGDQMGTAVAVDGDTAIVGAETADVGSNADQGAAYVYVRRGTIWVQQAKLLANGGATNERFGLSVAIFEDTAIVGAEASDNLHGAVYVFTRSSGKWTQSYKLIASDGAAGDRFGASVSLGSDTAVIGASGNAASRGAAYVFVRNQSSPSLWSLQIKLTASDANPGDEFGCAVSYNGRVVIGAKGDDDSKGSAYVFTRTLTSWRELRKLVAADGVVGDQFGASVSTNGEEAIIGAPARTVESSGGQGSAYVFTRSLGTQWTQTAQLVADNGAEGDFFGNAVAINGDTTIIGAYSDTVGSSFAQGSAYVFERNAQDGWQQKAHLTATDGAARDYFGQSVAVSGHVLIAGAPGTDVTNRADQGAARIFDLCPTITLNPGALADARAGESFSQALTATGGASPYQFSVVEGALPNGLTLSPTGAITGTPTTSGNFSFLFKATDANGCTGTQSYSLTVRPECVAITVQPETILPGKTGVNYSQVFSAAGGTAPYSFDLVDGALPAGMTLAPEGLLAGAPMATGSFLFTVGATDANGCTGERTYRLTVAGQTVARIVRVVPSSGIRNGTVVVPIELDASGEENTLSFSLNFDPSALANPQPAPGSDATNASVNFNLNQAAAGRLGAVLALPVGQKFAVGTRRILSVSFSVVAGANVNSTDVGFGDLPTAREVVSATASILAADFRAGTVTVSNGAAPVEGDIAPRPSGNGSVTITDWVQIGRLVAGLETPLNDSEFQRADCAPRDTGGDGRLTAADLVQVGRYAAGLDEPGTSTGPNSLAPLSDFANRQLRTLPIKRPKVNVRATQFGSDTIAIELDATGSENALSFSLVFDSKAWRLATVEPGSDATGATASVNTAEAGRVGVVLALSAGERLAPGVRQIALIRFAPIADQSGSINTIGFDDYPVAREVVDDKANVLPSAFAIFTDAINARAVTVLSETGLTGKALTAGSRVVSFGEGFTTTGAGLATAESAGVRVWVRDSSGIERQAVILSVSPEQISYRIPAGTAAGFAVITIVSGDGTVSVGTAQIAEAAVQQSRFVPVPTNLKSAPRLGYLMIGVGNSRKRKAA